jgi:hypothetical protein
MNKVELSTKMKTIKEWFKTLPEPYASQAIANSLPGNLEAKVSDLFIALSCGFKYRRSPQGFDYWKSFQDDLYFKNTEEQENGK